MIVGATGPYAASPMPTNTRSTNIISKLVASPVAPLAPLHTSTAPPISIQRR